MIGASLSLAVGACVGIWAPGWWVRLVQTQLNEVVPHQGGGICTGWSKSHNAHHPFMLFLQEPAEQKGRCIVSSGERVIDPGAEEGTSPAEAQTLVPNPAAGQGRNEGWGSVEAPAPRPPPAARRQSSGSSKALKPEKAQLCF